MDKLYDIALEGLCRYFHALSIFGYKNYSSVYRLLTVIFILDVFEEFYEFIDEKDLQTFSNCLTCMLGNTCLLDIPVHNVVDAVIHKNTSELTARATQDDIIRITEDEYVRIEE